MSARRSSKPEKETDESSDQDLDLQIDANNQVTRFNEDTRDPSFLEFKVPWEDERDIYKQNSPSALTKLLKHHLRKELPPEDVAVMARVGADLDRTLSIEEIIGAPPKPFIPEEIMEQIDRLPSWLRSMVIMKYPLIHSQYKDNTRKYFRAIANRVDKYRARLMVNDDGADAMGTHELYNFKLHDEGGGAPGQRGNLTDSAIAIRVAHQGGRWKPTGATTNEYWSPIDIARSNLKLRTALQTKAAQVDLASVAEDEAMLAVEQKAADSDDGEGNMSASKNFYLQSAFDHEGTKAAAEKQVEKDLSHHRKHLKEGKIKVQQQQSKRKAVCKSLKQFGSHKVAGLFRKLGQKGQAHLFVSKQGKRRKKRILLTRGYFRDPDLLFHNQCGGFQKTPKRLDRTYRWDDSFHNYCVALVSWFWFRIFVMVVIAINAIVLAVETGALGDMYAFWFEIFDNIFVAIYTVEFVLKIYAHPYRYWRSGFNVFDFIILTISITKSIIDWTNLADVDALRALLIVRALRILRGISLSVQLQVYNIGYIGHKLGTDWAFSSAIYGFMGYIAGILCTLNILGNKNRVLVSALVETIKTHVLSVVILLVLLLYVAAIIAFYFFGTQNAESFGTIGRGMLNMLRVLTIDGWTDLNDDLQKRSGHAATIFIIICIVLGNFLFSNIFVAIIIMNISEATDNFREKQKEQRDTVVRLKKEKVFRRQKLDLRQLFAKQKSSEFTDFFSIGCTFQQLLRHDDLVAMTDVVTSPLWIDSLYQSILRSSQTSNIMMNLHREIADNMLELLRMYREGKVFYPPIRRGRYNRYLRIKAKLAMIKREILKVREDQGVPRIRMRLPPD